MEMKLWRTEEVGLFDVNFDTGEQYWSYELRHILGVLSAMFPLNSICSCGACIRRIAALFTRSRWSRSGRIVPSTKRLSSASCGAIPARSGCTPREFRSSGPALRMTLSGLSGSSLKFPGPRCISARGNLLILLLKLIDDLPPSAQGESERAEK